MKALLLAVLLSTTTITTYAAPTTQVVQTEPEHLTLEQVYDYLVNVIGVSPEDAYYIITHSETYNGLFLQIAYFLGLLPYQP